MANYFVTSRHRLMQDTVSRNASHILSVICPGQIPQLHPQFPRKNWLMLNFDDVTLTTHPGAPNIHHVLQILSWGKDVLKEKPDANILVHCQAGVSRSTACALALMVQEYGNNSIDWCADYIVRVRECAMPNRLILSLADGILGSNGKLVEAGKRMHARFGKNENSFYNSYFNEEYPESEGDILPPWAVNNSIHS